MIRSPFVTLCSLLALALTVACAKQPEGGRCERTNDNNDCESGLECVSLQGLSGESEGAVCCPRNTNATTEICLLRVVDLNTDDDDDTTTDDDTTADDDTTTDDDTTGPSPASDAGTDAGSDAG